MCTKKQFAIVLAILTMAPAYLAAKPQRPYRLNSVNLKQPIIWGAEIREPEGGGLAFGGQDQDANDGRPHTRILVKGKWQAIHGELRARNPLEKYRVRAWQLHEDIKRARARARFVYFKGLVASDEALLLKKEVSPRVMTITTRIEQLIADLPKSSDSYVSGQVRFANRHLKAGQRSIPGIEKTITPVAIKQLHQAQIHLALAAEAFAAEPPPRALQCGSPRQRGRTDPPVQPIVYDPKTKLYVLFGGDHLDYLTNDTWVFDPAKQRWMQRHPEGAPPPRANHRLKLLSPGKIQLTGGYKYASNTDYVGGQYLDWKDGPWIYDIEKDRWTPAKDNAANLVPADSRLYRTGPFHPEFYLQGARPNAARFEAWLKKLPANRWVATNPLHRPRLNRDWGVARIDPDRDLMLRWSGGHSAHGGTDVPHFHFSTNRWELTFPVEFPLGQLYSNTSYPNGLNFNLRPWLTGHTYQNYAYDPPSKKMVFTGRPCHYYIYDPDVGDWIQRGVKPQAMQYRGCFYTLTLTATPRGAICWDRHGRVHRFDHQAGKWTELKLTGDTLPGAYVDSSTICHDSRRDRLLIINKKGSRTPYGGQVWSVDLKTGKVTALSPAGMEQAKRFANIDKCCYHPEQDLMLLGTYLRDGGAHTPTPVYDCANNRWVTLNLQYTTGKRFRRTTRAFPHSRSDALMYDQKRNLVWGTNTNGQVYVLRLELK